MPSALMCKLIGGAFLALALFLLVQDRNHWKQKAADRNAELGRVLDATRIAADNPGLGRGGMVMQIRLLGQSLVSVTGALNSQNDKVRELAATSMAQRKASAVAEKRALERGKAVAATSARLEASARSPAALTRQCEPSEALKEAWK